MKATRIIMITLVAVVLSGFVATVARADWDPVWSPDGSEIINHKMHYPQLPDLNETGLDVLANSPDPFFTAASVGKILADDWKCSQSGPVTDIHIWGSWWEDILPTRIQGDLLVRDPGYVRFRLSIHDDIPAVIDPSTGRVLEHSRPGPKLWEHWFGPDDANWAARLYASNVLEQFYDPNINQIVGVDTEVYQYNFFMDPVNAFVQEEGNIYWLDVTAVQMDPQVGTAGPIWGWKTSLDHFNDDAVFGDVLGLDSDPSLDPQEWFELRYPDGHPFEGESIDLSFVITPEPATLIVLALGLIPTLLRRRRKA